MAEVEHEGNFRRPHLRQQGDGDDAKKGQNHGDPGLLVTGDLGTVRVNHLAAGADAGAVFK